MSTKTTLKRIALVAVSALGFGVLTSVVPANAAQTTGVNVTAISISTDRAPIAGSVSSLHRFTFQTDTTTAGAPTIHPTFKLVSKPSTSNLAAVTTGDPTGEALAAGKFRLISGSSATDAPAQGALGSANPTYVTNATSSLVVNNAAYAYAASSVNWVNNVSGTNVAARVWLQSFYDVPGTYVWSVFADGNTQNNILDGTDYGQTFTVVVGSASTSTSATATFTAIGGSSSTTTYVATESPNGALVRLSLTDAAGNAIAPDEGSVVKVSVSGSALIDRVAPLGGLLSSDFNSNNGTGASSILLGARNFNASGRAWLNITNTAAETITLTAESTSFSAFTNGTIALRFTAANPATSALTVTRAATGSRISASDTYNYLGGTVTVTNGNTAVATASATAKTYAYNVTDANGILSGTADGRWTSAPVSANATTGSTYSITIPALPSTNSTGSIAISSGPSGSTAYTITPAVNGTATTLTSRNGNVLRFVTGATVSIPVNLKDNFGGNQAGATITTSISGRNAGATVATVVTDASGNATISYKDASTSTTNMQDVFTITSGNATRAVTVNYSSVAALGVANVYVSTPSTTAYSTTATPTTRVPTVFSTIFAGDGAEQGQKDVVVTVIDSNKVGIQGVPVTVSVAGTGVAITSTTQTVYTNAAGQATAEVYAWLAGTYTVTATAAGVTGTAVTSWRQDEPLYSRTVSVADVGGGVVRATVKDRFGNPVRGAVLTATRSGNGSFGGASSINGTTGSDGTVDFILSGGAATVTVSFSSADYGQTDAPKGNISSTAATDTFTAFTAGTAVLDEEGVGASFDAAGVNSASVAVTAVDAARDAADAAADAAAEAIDAANAATDAANLAAEAADAATVAAEEARDAADAATAAVEELATQVATLMAALKAQITTLANTVAKIAKKVKA